MITNRYPVNYGLQGLGDGLGDDPSTTVLNYPGMPDTTGINNPIPPGGLAPGAIAAYSVGNAAFFNAPPSVSMPPVPGSLTAWINANPSAMWWGVGIIAVLAFASEARR